MIITLTAKTRFFARAKTRGEVQTHIAKKLIENSITGEEQETPWYVSISTYNPNVEIFLELDEEEVKQAAKLKKQRRTATKGEQQ